MKLSIQLTANKNCVTATCNFLPETVKGDSFDQCIELLTEKIKRHICCEIRSGKISLSDPIITRFIAGSNNSFELETDLLNIEHEMFIEKVEYLMKKHYPTLLNEIAWWMLIPRYPNTFGDIYLNEEEEQELAVIKKKEKDAYDDLETNGPNGLKWQNLVKEHVENGSDQNVQMIVKHGIWNT